MAAGFNPAEFWVQSPRSFVAVMEGAALAAKRGYENNISLAWHTAAFNAATKSKKGLAKLDTFIGKSKPKAAQTPDEMFAALQAFVAAGAPMTIREIN